MEKQVFKEVWLPLSDSFYRVAYTMLGTEADARDAVQDLYIRLWNARHNLDTVSSPLPYGIRVIRNICIDRIRLRSARGESQDVESVKAVSDVYSPVSGRVAKVNEELLDAPESINQNPYEAWFVRIEDVTDQAELMSAGEYEEYVKNLDE